MKVKIKYFAIFRKVTNKKEEELEIKEGSTVKDLLEALSERYGKRFKDLIFDEKAMAAPLQFYLLYMRRNNIED